MEAESEGWDPVKDSLSRPPSPPPPPHTHIHARPRVIHYWSFRGGTFIVVLFVKCYVVFHFLMFYF